MASFLGCFVAGPCLRGNRIDHSESAGEGRVWGGGRCVPQCELRALEPPSCPLYHEGANGFPGEYPFRVGRNGLDTILHLQQWELRVRPMPPDPDPNSVVAQTGPQPVVKDQTGSNKRILAQNVQNSPDRSLKRKHPGAHITTDVHPY